LSDLAAEVDEVDRTVDHRLQPLEARMPIPATVTIFRVLTWIATGLIVASFATGFALVAYDYPGVVSIIGALALLTAAYAYFEAGRDQSLAEKDSQQKEATTASVEIRDRHLQIADYEERQA
jgi:hypothetical protein